MSFQSLKELDLGLTLAILVEGSAEIVAEIVGTHKFDLKKKKESHMVSGVPFNLLVQLISE